jgi:sugar phosphate isomerase/epimerase
MKLAGITQLADAHLAPFALWTGSFEERAQKAKRMGYDGLELVIRDPASLDLKGIKKVLDDHDLTAPQLVTGEMNIADGLHLVTPSDDVFQKAQSRIRSVIEMAAFLGAYVNIGSFRGRLNSLEKNLSGHQIALERIGKLAEWAAEADVRITLEPINRFEADFIFNAEEGIQFVKELGARNVGLMMDLFHMNIEDPSIEGGLESAMETGLLWHVHIADSNRLAPGRGHIDFQSVVNTLRIGNFEGYLSAEIIPEPDPDTAALETAQYMKRILTM